MLQRYNIQFNSDIYALASLQEWFLQFQNFLPKTVWMQCNLVLVEIFTNVVSYAHDGLDVKTPIDIELDINTDENLLELKIWDYGQPFDPVAEVERLSKEAQKNRDFENIDDIPTGGRGLIIAKMIADNIHYESISDGRNCFVMTKSFDPK
ncbi:MAG: ATP-binding protein [Pseudanabaena sp.]|uniref:ATP-binding protein n=1 Tax=Pseudanabaena mucicola TaxID=71190 RepID=UPI002576F379|nr:ATP-binding protein [Pseudanabaena mucicola]MCA6572153.1 ATP-binding protein [Pseudanabaena sp. M53BS1SP1A06MG]MCA6584431.1 ATP-binding protein [Pseudanabaena sp. M34BS1SP1A06MG]MCA6587508.1 ATP-binding protein [Pseudanabaena sp. M051S1SP1A06QC]MCA6589205.1 ATP-binding protein [Pseudanabaena sp. M109S1SP1A06QC]MCA6592743.1 ATP-binding protein [Pseudanabaena sp. M38BS1SP1A06MG]MCA6602354.1 ATP-binding protein [Pseudanabaena sp. M57BS1SP1A06MG]MCA6604275.1 ATP-binding protein [Pseudanabaena